MPLLWDQIQLALEAGYDVTVVITPTESDTGTLTLPHGWEIAPGNPWSK